MDKEHFLRANVILMFLICSAINSYGIGLSLNLGVSKGVGGFSEYVNMGSNGSATLYRMFTDNYGLGIHAAYERFSLGTGVLAYTDASSSIQYCEVLATNRFIFAANRTMDIFIEPGIGYLRAFIVPNDQNSLGLSIEAGVRTNHIEIRQGFKMAFFDRILSHWLNIDIGYNFEF